MRRHPQRKPKDTQAARWAALTPQLDAFLTGIEPQAKAKPLATAPEPIVQLARQLLDETRRLLPGRARKQTLPRLGATGAIPAKVDAGFAVPDRDHEKNCEGITFAEASLVLGQARASLKAWGAAQNFGTPEKPRPDTEALRTKITRRIEELAEQKARDMVAGKED